jgi:hypothetical protein
MTRSYNFHTEDSDKKVTRYREHTPNWRDHTYERGQTWTPQEENKAERKESFVLRQMYFSVNNDNTIAWKYIDLRSSQKVNSSLKMAK